MSYYNRSQDGNPFSRWNSPGSRPRPEEEDPSREVSSQEYGSGRPQPPEGERRPEQEPQKQESWQNDPSLKNMDLKKLAFLSELVSQSGGKSLDALLPFLVAANQNANSMGLQFSDSETDLILKVLKSRMSPQEQSQIDLFRKMADLLGKKHP